MCELPVVDVTPPCKTLPALSGIAKFPCSFTAAVPSLKLHLHAM
uniref:Uncharacterized protein n=1 Tax=Arundo donax TaxID=35708 RepID=A0A0A9EMN3_ARUDO